MDGSLTVSSKPLPTDPITDARRSSGIQVINETRLPKRTLVTRRTVFTHGKWSRPPFAAGKNAAARACAA